MIRRAFSFVSAVSRLACEAVAARWVRCTACGFDLRSTPIRCPECGTPPVPVDRSFDQIRRAESAATGIGVTRTPTGAAAR